MNFKRFSGAILLCSSFFVINAQDLGNQIFDANVTIKGYTMMENGGRANSSFSVYTGYMGDTPDTEQHIQLSGNETSYGTIIPAIASLSKFGTLMPLNFHSKDFNFIGGPVRIDSTLTVVGESSLQNTLSVFPIKGAPYNVKISADDMTPTISFGGKDRQSIAGKFKGSSFVFSGGPGKFDSVYVKGGVCIVPSPGTPRSLSLTTDNYVPTLSFMGQRDQLCDGKIKASSFSFSGGPVKFDTMVMINGECRVYDELFVCPNTQAPLGVSIMSGENYTPTISFRGPQNSIQRGSIQASTLFIDGKMGIGTNVIDGDVQLQVAGKILCKGDFEVASIDASDIKTNDITVKMNDVADYVFEEGYDLKNLSEVEAYVNANKHLPGIPSAAEIEKDGVSLSKMTNLLLEKVEELTLHMIQLEKENKALKAEVQSLKK